MYKEGCVSENTVPQVSPDKMESSIHFFGNSELAFHKLFALPFTLQDATYLFMQLSIHSNMEAHFFLSEIF